MEPRSSAIFLKKGFAKVHSIFRISMSQPFFFPVDSSVCVYFKNQINFRGKQWRMKFETAVRILLPYRSQSLRRVNDYTEDGLADNKGNDYEAEKDEEIKLTEKPD